MPSIIDTCTTLVALVLAVTAAIISTPGHADAPWQLSEWLQLSICPEADAMAGAIGENPAQVVPP
jgi:hypothetical protein